MNREIKFKAWNKVKKTMSDRGVTLNELIFTALELEPKKDDRDDRDDRDDYVWLQYTGLKDKNGVEIYEGDIISQLKGNLVVAFNTGCASFCFTKDIEDKDAETYIMGSTREQRERELAGMEVLGNIYQNPELLK